MTRFLKMAVLGFGLIGSTKCGIMCLPVHQRTDAVRLFEPRRYGFGKLPNVGVSDDGPYRSSDPTSSTSTAWDVGVFAAARAPRLSLRS